MSNAEARGLLRVWKRAAAERYADYRRAAESKELLLVGQKMARSSSAAGRLRAFRRLRGLISKAHLEAVSLAGKYPVAIWSVLKPREAVTVDNDDPSLQQDCVVIEYFVVGMLPNYLGDRFHKVDSRANKGQWTLEVPDHALRRLIVRAPGVDIGATLMTAHHAVLRARDDNEQLFPAAVDPDKSFLVPAGDGVFVCGLVLGEDVKFGTAAHVFAHTWLHNDQLHDDQTPLLVERGTGARLGESLLLPLPLRRMTRVDGQLKVVAWQPAVAALAAPPT